MIKKIILTGLIYIIFPGSLYALDIFNPDLGLKYIDGMRLLGDVQLDSGGVSWVNGVSPHLIVLPGDNPLDTLRYFIFKARIYTDRKLEFSITYWSNYDNWYNQCGESENIILTKGWNDISLDLRHLSFFWNGGSDKYGWGGVTNTVDKFKLSFSSFKGQSLKDGNIRIKSISFQQGLTRYLSFDNEQKDFLLTAPVGIPPGMKCYDLSFVDGGNEDIFYRKTNPASVKSEWTNYPVGKVPPGISDNARFIQFKIPSKKNKPRIRLRLLADNGNSAGSYDDRFYISPSSLNKLSRDEIEKMISGKNKPVLSVDVKRDPLELFKKLLKRYRYLINEINFVSVEDKTKTRRFILAGISQNPSAEFHAPRNEEALLKKLRQEADPRSHIRYKRDKFQSFKRKTFYYILLVFILTGLFLLYFYTRKVFVYKVLLPVFLLILFIYVPLFIKQVYEDINLKRISPVVKNHFEAGKGSKKTIHNLPVVTLSGTPYEIGYQHGILLNGEVNKTVNDLLSFAYNRFGGRIIRPVFNFILDCLWEKSKPRIPLSVIEELKGLSDGSGIPLITLKRIHTIPTLFSAGCSGFTAVDSATADGGYIQTRNLDWYLDLGIEDQTVLFVVKPDGKTPYLNLGYAGFIGVISGMNKKGVVITEIGSTSLSRSYRGTPMIFLMKIAFEESSSVEDAEMIIKNLPRTLGFNYIVGNINSGKSRLIESTSRYFRSYPANDSYLYDVKYVHPVRDVLVGSAPVITPGIRNWQICAGSSLLKSGIEFPVNSSYYTRYLEQTRLVNYFYGGITPENAALIAGAAGSRENLQSIVFTKDYLLIAWASNNRPAPLQGYKRFYLKDIWE